MVDRQHTCCTRWRRFACGVRREARPWGHRLRAQHDPHGAGAWPPQPSKWPEVWNEETEQAHNERAWELELFKSQAETPLTKYICTGKDEPQAARYLSILHQLADVLLQLRSRLNRLLMHALPLLRVLQTPVQPPPNTQKMRSVDGMRKQLR